MRKFFYSPILILLVTCNENDSNRVKKDSNSPNALLKADSSRVIYYNEVETRALDSISLYDLDSLHKLSIKLLYGLYAMEIINDIDSKRALTVGECNIRIIKFNYDEREIRSMDFELFSSDSLPINSDRNTEELGSMIYRIKVNIKNRSMVSAINEGGMSMVSNDFIEMSLKRMKSKDFKNYILINRDKTHPNFMKSMEKDLY